LYSGRYCHQEVHSLSIVIYECEARQKRQKKGVGEEKRKRRRKPDDMKEREGGTNKQRDKAEI
jgi:hypothetical protein